MAVPSWPVFDPEASLCVCSQDDVLVDLVQSVSNVYRAIGVWRAIVQNEGVALAPLVLGRTIFLLPGIKVVGALFSVFEKFLGGWSGGKGRLGQVQRLRPGACLCCRLESACQSEHGGAFLQPVRMSFLLLICSPLNRGWLLPLRKKVAIAPAASAESGSVALA